MEKITDGKRQPSKKKGGERSRKIKMIGKSKALDIYKGLQWPRSDGDEIITKRFLTRGRLRLARTNLLQIRKYQASKSNDYDASTSTGIGN